MASPEIGGPARLSRRRLLELAATIPAGWALSRLRPARADEPDRAADMGEGLTGRLLFSGFAARAVDPTLGGLFVLDLKAMAWRRIVPDNRGFNARLSPDGKAAAYSCVLAGDRRVFVVDADGGEPRPVFDGNPDGTNVPFWSPDGRELIVAATLPPRGATETWRIDADGSKKARLPIPESETVVDWSSDGGWLLTFARGEPKEGDPSGLLGASISVRRADGTDPHRIGKPGDRGRRFSRDGRRVLVSRLEGEDRRRKSALWMVDRDGTDSRRFFTTPEGAVAFVSCVSPDGTRAMLTWYDDVNERGEFRPTSGRIEVLDLDGGRHRTLDLPHPQPLALDWR